MLFPMLSDRLDRARWSFSDIDFTKVDKTKVDAELIHDMFHVCLTEVGSIPATAMFMRDFRHDMDFQRFIAIWGYEEGKHSLAIERWLNELGVEVPQAEMEKVNLEFETAPWIETLTMHFLGEQRLGLWYGAFSGIAPGARDRPVPEPVLRQILELMAQDEWRHAGAYFAFLKKAVKEDPASLERIAKMTLWMLRSPGRHPTNITDPSVMGVLPDPNYYRSMLERYMTPEGEKVMEKRVLSCFSILANETVETPRDLSKYLRKHFGAKAVEPIAALV